MSPLFERLDKMHDSGLLAEDELDMMKLAVIELAQDEVEPGTDSVGTDGRDYVLHAQDACEASGIDLSDDADEDEGDDE
jgi:hypothetical protein